MYQFHPRCSIICYSLLFIMAAYTGMAQAVGELVPSDEEAAGGSVTIEGRDRQVIDEFRINGQLYMIRVNPAKGPSYFLVDADGDGNLETRANELSPSMLIPAWVLKSW